MTANAAEHEDVNALLYIQRLLVALPVPRPRQLPPLPVDVVTVTSVVREMPSTAVAARWPLRRMLIRAPPNKCTSVLATGTSSS